MPTIEATTLAVVDRGRIVAICSADRVLLTTTAAALPVGHPDRGRILARCLTARAILAPSWPRR